MTERNYSFEALAEVTGTDWKEGRGELNAALKSIREQSVISDDYLLADEIHERAKMYRQVMPDVMCTPSALAKHWKRVEEEVTKPKGTNLTAYKECATCGGDRFVVVATRKPQQSEWMRERNISPDETELIEEMAPCPDCNLAVDASFHRYDGPKIVPPDPAKVREMMVK